MIGQVSRGSPGEYQADERAGIGGSLVGCHLWGRAESDTTEVI